NKEDTDVTIGIRLPGWRDEVKGSVDGSAVEIAEKCGYWYVQVPKGEHRILLDMEIKPKRWYANLNVSEDIHKVAVARGPQVYCVEGKDNGEDLHKLVLRNDSELTDHFEEELLGGVSVVEGDGERLVWDGSEGASSGLYTWRPKYKKEAVKIRFIPYNTWGNRGENEMRVWITEE
ncbi:MAG: glycoside hydrolase family 127 protein, partial [Butyrivibrio sp.]|nr:glycoside hydrolase family 127 protein [Butyrivibrio sp.]